MQIPLLAVLKNLVNSEKAIVALGTLVFAGVFVFTGEITVEQWMDFAKWVVGFYITGKAIHGAASAFNGGGNQLHAVTDRVAELEARLITNDLAADEAAEAKDE